MPKVKNSKYIFKRKGLNKDESPDSVKVIQDELIESIDLEEKQTSKDASLLYGDKNQDPDDLIANELGNETSKFMETFASEMNKAFLSKKRDIEMFTDNVIKINHSYLSRTLNSLKKNDNIVESFCPKFIGVVDEIEEDISRQKEREEKIKNIFQHHIKVIEQQRISQLRKLEHLRNLKDTFVKELEKRKSKYDELVEKAMEEMKQEIMLMQKKRLMEIQQQEMKNMRRSLQSIFYS